MDLAELEPRRIAALGRPAACCWADARVGVTVPIDGDVVMVKVGDFKTLVGVSIIFCLTRY